MNNELSAQQIKAIEERLSQLDIGLWSRGGISTERLLNAIYQEILNNAKDAK